MSFESLHDRLPRLAEAETRTVTVLESSVDSKSLPPSDYTFVEMFCNEPGCDCRRVFFSVASSRTQKMEAVIAYGWENRKFYRDWFKHGTADDITMLQGPVLNEGSLRTKHSEAILQLFIDNLLPQKAYIERVKRHYKQFRATVDAPRNPLLRRRRTGG